MSRRPANYYVVTRARGENWDNRLPLRQQEQWDEHATFMDALADEGFIILGGPLGNEEKVFLLIVNAESEQDISARLTDDPWTPIKLLRTISIEHWNILLRGARK